MDETRRAAVRAVIEPILEEQGLELVELTSRPQGHQQLIRVLVDRVGGVTIRQCAFVNQRISQALEAADPIEGSYVLEVSSPGLDRPLVTPRDFERAVGEELVVERLLEDGRRTQALQGMLLSVRPEAIVLTLRSGNETIPMAQIRSAKKALRW